MKKLFCAVTILGFLFFFTPETFAQSGGGSSQDTTLAIAVYFLRPAKGLPHKENKADAGSKAETYMAVLASRVTFYKITCTKCDILKWTPAAANPIDGAATPVRDPELKKELLRALRAQAANADRVLQKEM